MKKVWGSWFDWHNRQLCPESDDVKPKIKVIKERIKNKGFWNIENWKKSMSPQWSSMKKKYSGSQ